MSQPMTIDYTNKDYASLRAALLNLARDRLPEWTDQSPSDLGVLLVDLFAYMGDIILYYQDRIANESFLHTAAERRSVVNLLRLIGYELAPPVPAAAELLLTFKAPAKNATPFVVIPAGAQFATKPINGVSQTFEYLGPALTLNLASDQVRRLPDGRLVYAGLPVQQVTLVPSEALGTSTGEPNLAFALKGTPLWPESLLVEVNEGAGWVGWTRRESLLFNQGLDGQVQVSSPDANDYSVQFDENGVASVLFGDGVYGRRPPAGSTLRATYRVGGGAAGNVPAGTLTVARTVLSLLDSVTNPLPAAGGADSESHEHAVRFGPLSFRSAQRAVTLSDYVALAHQAGGVAKVRARSSGWNEVELFVAPEGDSWRPVPEELRRRLVAFFEDKRMVGTFVIVRDAVTVPIEISMDVVARQQYRPESVQQAVDTTVRGLLAFAQVDFAVPIYLSDIYSAVEAVPGVSSVTVTRFRRRDTDSSAVEQELARLNLPPLKQLPDVLRRGLQVDVSPEGRIDLGDFELPEVGTLEVAVKAATR